MTAKQKQTLDTMSEWCELAIATNDDGELIFAAHAVSPEWLFTGTVKPDGDLKGNKNISVDEWNEIAEICEYNPPYG